MKEYIEWLENKIEVCLNDKDLNREHWAFCQALKKYREYCEHLHQKWEGENTHNFKKVC